VAVLDTSFAGIARLGKLVSRYRVMAEDARELSVGGGHGAKVLAVYLFGEYPEKGPPSRPYTAAEAVRVTDASAEQDNPARLPHILVNIVAALKEGGYDLAVLSDGPDTPAKDGFVSHWTAALDRLAYELRMTIVAAAGNNGAGGPASPGARVEVPGDGFNVVSVGFSETGPDGAWKRAKESPVGPGFSEAIRKPDVVAFGGNRFRPLRVYQPEPGPSQAPVEGSSYAAPMAARTFAALMAMAGPGLSVESLRAAVVHYSERGGRDPKEVGWGFCPDFRPGLPLPAVRPWIFQGELEGDRFARARLEGLAGFPAGTRVKLKATLFSLRKPDYCVPHERGMKSLVPFLAKGPDSAPGPGPGGGPAEIPFFTKWNDGVHWPNTYSDEGVFEAGELKGAAFEIRRGDRGLAGDDLIPIKFSLVVTAEPLPRPDASVGAFQGRRFSKAAG
jgi:hypothetical protein